MDEYLRLRRRQAPSHPNVVTAPSVVTPSESTSSGLSGAERRQAEKEVASIERRLDKLTTEVADLHQRLSDHDHSDYVGLQRLSEQLRTTEDEAAKLEDRWLELSDQLT